MDGEDTIYVAKVYAYITRRGGTQLLVFRGSDHDGLQVPKGTIEPGEPPLQAAHREIAEESGLEGCGPAEFVARDVWTRRTIPVRKQYVRHFFHFGVDEPRDEWTHVVTGEGEERGRHYRYQWIPLPTAYDFALSIDDYLGRLG